MTMPKIKLFAIAKDEGAYIPQWVFHHFHFGFDEIEIWLNGIEDNSVEVCQEITQHTLNFTYKIVDDILEKCNQENNHFQRFTYKKAYERAKDQGFTHLLFLDLDEYWMPNDFKTSIKQVVTDNIQADCISFAWCWDEASTTKIPFNALLIPQQKIFKDRHLKTLIKISDKVDKVDIHNHHVSNGIYVLSNGEVLDIKNPDTLQGAILPEEYFIKNLHQLDNYFIIHFAFKSQMEYLSSLIRGNKQVHEDDLFKTNRWSGFTNGAGLNNYKINEYLLDSYNQNFNEFLDTNNLWSLLIQAQLFVTYRYEKTINAIRENSDLVQDSLLYLFKGVSFSQLSQLFSVDYCIDNTQIENKQVIITGWVLTDNDEQIAFYKKSDDKLIEIQGKLLRTERLDVSKSKNLENVNTGFYFLFDSAVLPTNVTFLKKSGKKIMFLVT